MDQYEITFKTWDHLAQKYQDVFMDLNLYDDSYNTFCTYIQKPEAGILELGCGPGNVTKYLLNKRPDFQILATDVAPNMLNLAKINNPGATFEILDCRNLDSIKLNFDALVCGFCLPYLSQNDVLKLINDAFQLLLPEGIIYLSLIEGDYLASKLETSSDGQHSMFVYYYSEEFITKSLQEKNFKVAEIIRIPYTKSSGEQSTHLIFIARKK